MSAHNNNRGCPSAGLDGPGRKPRSSTKIRAAIAVAPYHRGVHFDDDTVEPDQIFDRDGRPVDGVGPRFDPNVGSADDGREQDFPPPPKDTIVLAAAPSNPIAVAHQLVDELMSHHDQTLTTRWWRGDYYGWTGSHWVDQSTAKLRSALYGTLEHAYYPAGLFTFEPWEPTRRKIGDLLEALQALVHLDERTDPPQWICGNDRGPVISVANGNLRINGRALAEHTPALFNLSSLPYDFDAHAARPDRWLAFLDELWPDDQESIDLLQEWFGYVVSGDTDQHKIALLVGPPRAGKGTIARVMTALVGKGSVASPTLASLGQNFGLQPLIGKSVAIVGDVRLGKDTFVITERLLSISGEDTITIDRKYRDPWTGKLGVRFMVLSNELPKLGDASGALASRFVVLQLQQSWLGREDLDLQDKLDAELAGIFIWALEGLDRILARRRFTQPTSSDEAIQTLEELSSPIRHFIRDECEIGPLLEVAVDTIYEKWKWWCYAQGRDRVTSKQMFGRDLRAALPSIRQTQPRTGESRYRVYVGVSLVKPT